MSYGAGYDGTAQGPIPMGRKRRGNVMGRARGRGATAGPAVPLRTRIPGSMRHGGHTGHFAGGRPGPYAASPHNAAHAGGTTGGFASQGHGFQQGPYAASPFGGGLGRSTGYKGTHGDYSAATPQMGFKTGARGNYQGCGPGGY